MLLCTNAFFVVGLASRWRHSPRAGGGNDHALPSTISKPVCLSALPQKQTNWQTP